MATSGCDDEFSCKFEVGTDWDKYVLCSFGLKGISSLILSQRTPSLSFLLGCAGMPTFVHVSRLSSSALPRTLSYGNLSGLQSNSVWGQ